MKIKKNFYHVVMSICFLSLFITLCAKQSQNPQESESIVFTRSNQTLGDVLTFGMAIADVDLDEDNDIFIGHYHDNGESRLWINDGNGNFTLHNQQFGSHATHDVDIADLNGDLYPDIFMVNHHGPSKIYFNNGNGSFTIGGQNIGNSSDFPQTIQLDDVDGDLDKDAYIYNSSAPNRIWENDGNGFFIMRNIDYGGNDSNNQILADFNNDTYPDLFISMRTGPSQIWMNDGAGNITNSGHTLGGGGEAIDCDDVDGDDDTDIVVAAAGEITIWLNQNNTGTFVSGFTFGEGATECKLFDVDLDGDLDLVTGHFENSCKLWINDGTGSFISLGTIFGNSIIHSLECGKLDDDNDYDIILGFEPGSGGIAIYFNESIIDAIDKNNSGSIAKDFQLLQNYPNPFNLNTTISFALNKQSLIELKIYDTNGRLIRNLLNQYHPIGVNKVVWDGKDNFGNIVSSGNYYYKIKSEYLSDFKRMLLLK